LQIKVERKREIHRNNRIMLERMSKILEQQVSKPQVYRSQLEFQGSKQRVKALERKKIAQQNEVSNSF
jgi:hypothetical protein